MARRVSISMHWSIALGILVVPSVASLLFAIGASILGRWLAADLAARVGFFAAASALATTSLALVSIWLFPRVALLFLLPSEVTGADVDPREKARALGQCIAATMNSAALRAALALFCTID